MSSEEETQALEGSIVRFSNSLLPVQQLHGTLPADKHSLIVVHTLVQAAGIRLHYRAGEEDPVRHEKCLRAARTCLFIIRHIGDSDYDFLDPIIGVRIFLLSYPPYFDGSLTLIFVASLSAVWVDVVLLGFRGERSHS